MQVVEEFVVIEKKLFFGCFKVSLLCIKVNFGSGIVSLFCGKVIDDDLYEEFEM